MIKLRSFLLILFASMLCFQLFAQVGSSAHAQEPYPTIPAPPYIEPVPVKKDLESGGQTLRVGALDATSVETLTLGVGESSIHGMIYDGGFLWASTRTVPGKIIKINPATTPMTVVSRITLSTNRNNAEDIVAANGYIWSIASETNGALPSGLVRLIRVDPATMAVQETILFIDSNNYLSYGESLKFAHGKLWAGGYNKIAEIDISTPGPPTFSLHDYSVLHPQGYVWATALASDSTHLWAVFTRGVFTPPSLVNSTIARIDPLTPTSGYLTETISALFPDDMIHTNGFLYTSSENSGIPSYAYQIPPDLLSYSTQLASSTGISYGVFFNPLDPYSFWGAYTGSPGKLIKFDLDMDQLWTFDLPTVPDNFEDPSEIAFDNNGNMYVSTFENPSRIVRYTAPDAVALSISKSGSNAVLEWMNNDSLVDHYEIWRSTDPYFTPQGTVPYDTVTATDGLMSYTDYGVLGDVDHNYFYVVRAFNDFGLLAPVSNRVGEYEYAIQTTGASTYNDIALVLDIPNVSDAESLATYLGSFVIRVMRYYTPLQAFQIYDVGDPDTNFPLFIGDFVFLITNNSAPATIALAGEVPDPGSVSFSLISGSPAKYNFMSLPLDQGAITAASDVADDIGSGVIRVLKYYNNFQVFQIYDVGDPDTDFSLVTGEPFGLVLTTGAPPNWP